MYTELERHTEGLQKGQLTEEQKEKLFDIDDARQHFTDLINMFPLFEGRIEAFKKVLEEAGWERKSIEKIHQEASSFTNWNSSKKITTEMIAQGRTSYTRIKEHPMGMGRF